MRNLVIKLLNQPSILDLPENQKKAISELLVNIGFLRFIRYQKSEIDLILNCKVESSIRYILYNIQISIRTIKQNIKICDEQYEFFEKENIGTGGVRLDIKSNDFLTKELNQEINSLSTIIDILLNNLTKPNIKDLHNDVNTQLELVKDILQKKTNFVKNSCKGRGISGLDNYIEALEKEFLFSQEKENLVSSISQLNIA